MTRRRAYKVYDVIVLDLASPSHRPSAKLSQTVKAMCRQMQILPLNPLLNPREGVCEEGITHPLWNPDEMSIPSWACDTCIALPSQVKHHLSVFVRRVPHSATLQSRAQMNGASKAEATAGLDV